MTESAETYLRRFAEAQLLRLAAGEATAADCASRVDAVAAALEETSALDRERAEDIAAGFDLAVAARSPERDTPLHAGRRSQVSALRRSAGFGAIFARKAPMRSRLTVDNEILAAKLRARGLTVNGEGPGKSRGGTLVVPAGAVLRPRDDGADEDIYLLSYVGTPNSAWLNVAAYTARSRAPRRHASPPSARSAGSRRAGRPTIAGRPTFVGGGMTAVDDAGRQYNLGFSGGGDLWYLGRLSLHPVPPPGISWLEIRCGEQSVRLDLTGAPPCAEVTTRPAANTPGEAYLLGRAEWLLDRVGNADVLARLAAVETTGLASAVPALRAVGVLPDGSLVPGQVAALAERLGAPGRMIAEPGELPERWASLLNDGLYVTGGGPTAAAHLAAVLPEADGLAIHLAGLVTLPGMGTRIFGGLRVEMPARGGQSPSPGQALWLRDDRGSWHSVSLGGWSSCEDGYSFQAAVVPPVGPETSHIELYITGPTTEVRVASPLTWWVP